MKMRLIEMAKQDKDQVRKIIDAMIVRHFKEDKGIDITLCCNCFPSDREFDAYGNGRTFYGLLTPNGAKITKGSIWEDKD